MPNLGIGNLENREQAQLVQPCHLYSADGAAPASRRWRHPKAQLVKRSELHLIDLGGNEMTLMDSYLTEQSFLCCYWVQQP